MPKINVYLPDDLAEAVRDTGVPVSAICQRALEQSVKRVAAIRATVVGDLSTEDPTTTLTSFTQRARDALKLGITRARERGAAEVGSEDLLHGMLTEGANLGLHVLRSLEVDPAQVLRELERVSPPDSASEPASRMSTTAASALELTVTEALALGHNYVGCEHLVLGFVAEPDGTAGQVLRGLGVDLRPARQAVTAMLSGYVLAKQAGQADVLATAVGKALEPVIHRLDRLEQHAGLS